MSTKVGNDTGYRPIKISRVLHHLLLMLLAIAISLPAATLFSCAPKETSTPVAAPVRTPNPAPASTGTKPSANVPGTSKRYMSSPAAPLPAPAVVSSGPEEERAALLAQQVLAGGEGALPALLAALQQAGFSVRDAGGKIVLRPAGQSQGIVFEQWEVNALADLIVNREQVTVPLDNFAETLASPLKQLQGAAMADLILDGVRKHARDKEGHMLFWAMFIVELGRQDRTHKPYDLLFTVDPAQTRLDTLQIAFLTRRLAADLAVLANPGKAVHTQGLRLPASAVQMVAYAPAQSGCRFDGIEAEIMDWVAAGAGTGFGTFLDYLIAQGMSAAETYSTILGFANVILAYAKLANTMAAFDIQFDMEGGTPLVRTKEMWPETGEKKTIVATLKLDNNKAQWANCFRLVLNAVGADFNVETNGLIEGASLSWSGESGFGGSLVEFVGDAAGRIQNGGSGPSPILDSRTGSDGKARVQVEGVGQREKLGGDPKPVMKEAEATAMAILKPANMYRDLKDATITAMGGLGGLLTVPVEMLYRTNLAFGGTYTFPVKDWKPGNDAWTGTITDTMVKRQIVLTSTDSVCCGGKPVNGTQSEMVLETVEQRWEIGSDADAEALTPEFAMATASYSISAGITSVSSFRRTGWNACKTGPQATFSKHTVTEVGSASLSGQAQVTINIDADGNYSVGPGGPDGVPGGNRYITGVLEYGPGCEGTTPSQTTKKTLSYSPSYLNPMIEGKVDPNNPDTLSGTRTEVEKDSKVGITITHTYTWDLRR